MISALLIAGPTASGKSRLAITLAKKLGGAVINADSMQVYADLPVLAASPTASERAQAPHFLFGHVDGAVNYSAGLWLKDVAQAIARVQTAGLLPVVTGGTGLYFKALTQGLSQIPEVPDAVRAQVRAEAQGQTPQALHRRLAEIDTVMAGRLRPSDPQRILRALEIFAATGRSLAHYQGLRAPPLLGNAAGFFLAPEKAVFRARIDARFDEMLRDGALAEVEALLARQLDPALPAMRALGVPQLADYLRGQATLDAAADRSKADIRAYAKRQFTFARHQLPDFAFVAPEAAEGEILARVDRVAQPHSSQIAML